MNALQQFCRTMAAMTIVLLSAVVVLRAEVPLSPVGAVAKGSITGSMQDGITQSTYTVNFRWTPNPKGGVAAGYSIYVWNDEVRDWYRLVSTGDLFYKLTEDQLPMNGKELYFHITAFNDEGESLPEYKLYVSFREKDNNSAASRVVFTSAPSGKAWTEKRYVYDADAASEGVKEEIVYELSTSARRAMINPTSGLVVWTPPAQPGVYKFAVTARLASRPEVQTTQTWIVQVSVPEPSNEQQFTFLTKPEERAVAGEVYRYDVGVQYNGTGKVHFAVERGPAGVVVEAKTGKLLWKPIREGDYTFEMHAIADEEFGTVEAIQVWTVTVERAPQTEFFFVTVPVGNGVAGQDYRYDADTRYNGKGTVRYTLDDAPKGAVVDAKTGVITWQPTEGGVYDFYLRATTENALSSAEEVIQAWAVFVPVDAPAPGEIVTGLTDPFQQVLHVTARPNPAVSELVVQFNAAAGTAHISLYDVAGANVLQMPFHAIDGDNTASLNVTALPVGQYFLHVESVIGRQMIPVRIGR